MAEGNLIIDIIIALFIPPVAVYIKEGTSGALWLNLLLCLLIWFPAVIHALYVVFKYR